MKNSIIYLLLFVSWLIVGCSGSSKSDYYSNGINSENVYDVQVQILNDSSLWRFPLQMEYTDSLLVVLDYMDDYYFHVYTLRGEPVGHFARKGQGPGELLSANQFHLSEDRDSLYVYDGVSRKIVMYKLNGDYVKDLLFQEYKIDYTLLPPSDIPYILYDMLPVKDEVFLVKANQPKLRYGKLDLAKGEITSVYGDFPTGCVAGKAEEVWSVFSSDTRTCLKPDCSKVLNATYIGGILEYFSVQPDLGLRADTALYIYEPVYGLAEGAVPSFVVGNENTQLGFEDVYATDQFVYALLHEKGDAAAEPQSVMVFDWQGKALRKINVKQRLLRLCVDEARNMIYAMAADEVNGYKLVSIPLKYPR